MEESIKNIYDEMNVWEVASFLQYATNEGLLLIKDENEQVFCVKLDQVIPGKIILKKAYLLCEQ